MVRSREIANTGRLQWYIAYESLKPDDINQSHDLSLTTIGQPPDIAPSFNVSFLSVIDAFGRL